MCSRQRQVFFFVRELGQPWENRGLEAKHSNPPQFTPPTAACGVMPAATMISLFLLSVYYVIKVFLGDLAQEPRDWSMTR